MGEKKTKLMLYSTLVEIEVEVGVELGKNDMNSHQNFIFAPRTKVPLEQFLHGQESSWTNVPWTKVSLANCHLDKCSNPTR